MLNNTVIAEGSQLIWIPDYDTLDNSGCPQTIAWLEANDAQRTLGSYIAPDGSSAKQLDVLLGHLSAWRNAICNITVGNLHAKWLSYQNVFSRKIMYPLIGHSFSESDLQIIQKPTDRELLHLLGLNEHFPRAVLHSSMSFGGMGCPTFHAQHIADKIVLFVHHMKENKEIAEVLKASMSFTQLECGTSTPFFSLPVDPWKDLVTPTWINHIWNECAQKGIEISFHNDHFWTPSAQRVNDHTLMDLAEHMYGNTHLMQINQCRLALQVTYLSDITSVDGKRILPAYYNGKGHIEAGRKTRLNWPPTGDLPSAHWARWREFLNRLCGTSLKLPTPLGAWYQDKEILTQILYFLHDQRLITLYNNNWYELRPYHPASRTRFSLDPILFSDLHVLPDAYVVDVSKRSDSLYIVSKSRQNIIASTRANPASSIQDLYTALPLSLQRLMGHIEWPDEETTRSLAEAIRQGKAVGASDGSVRAKEDKASHAWIIQAPDGAEIVGKGPVDGMHHNRTSHRAELQGQTGLMLMVSLFVHFYSIASGHIATYCDNKPVVTKLKKRWDMLRLRHTKGPDTDLQAAARSIFQQLGSKCTYTTEWVRSHQDKSTPLHALPREVALNVRMDAETKEAYNLPNEWQTQETVPVLPAECCAVYISDRKITSSLYPTLLERWHEEEARSYLQSRHNIDTNLFNVIQWRSLRFALKKFNHHRRATAVKAIHRHLPTQDKLFKQGRVTMSALCPRCMQHPETNAHVYACSNTEATNQRVKDWQEFNKQLTTLRTANIIRKVWAQHLSPILALPPPSGILQTMEIDTDDELSYCLNIAIDEQQRIGWDKLLLGMAASMWQTVQHMVDMDNPRPPSRSANDWMNRVVHQLLKLSLRCWKSRNVSIHGSNVKECRRLSLDRARETITSIYANPPPLAPQFRSITEVTLAQRLRLPLQAAEHWIALIKHQAKVSAHNMRVLLRQHRPIQEHFKSMDQTAKKQATQRLRSSHRESIRSAHSRRVQKDVKAMRMRLYRSIPSMVIPNAEALQQPRHSPVASVRHRRPTPRRHPP